MALRLRDHLYWCRCADRLILLDLEADRYFCLPVGLEEPFIRASQGRSIAGDEERLRSLVDRGLLAERDTHGASREALTMPASATADLFPEMPGKAGFNDVMRAAALDLWMSRQIRKGPFSLVVTRARHRARAVRRLQHSAADEALGRIVSSFRAVALVAREADRCLVRALAVHVACCRAGIAADLVVGVQLHPFQAHAWVQIGDKVLVGDFEQVRLFSPIAVLA